MVDRADNYNNFSPFLINDYKLKILVNKSLLEFSILFILFCAKIWYNITITLKICTVFDGYGGCTFL